MSKIFIEKNNCKWGKVPKDDSVRLTLKERQNLNLSTDFMGEENNKFVKMYGIKRLNDKVDSTKAFLGIIHQLNCAKHLAKNNQTIIIEEPGAGLHLDQKEIVVLSILELVRVKDCDVVLETQDADIIKMLDVAAKVSEEVKEIEEEEEKRGGRGRGEEKYTISITPLQAALGYYFYHLYTSLLKEEKEGYDYFQEKKEEEEKEEEEKE